VIHPLSVIIPLGVGELSSFVPLISNKALSLLRHAKIARVDI